MLHLIRPARGATQKRKRVARGDSAGGGSTAGRGTKGQQSRTGKGHRFGFEGGQVPLIRRQPKLGGFINVNRVDYEVINLETLEPLTAGAYDAAALRAEGVLTSKRPVKLLGRGTLSKKFELTIAAASKSAKAAVTKAGGTVRIAA